MSNGNIQRKPKMEDSSSCLRGKHLKATVRIIIAHQGNETPHLPWGGSTSVPERMDLLLNKGSDL
jgi:hypothetical protein